MFPQAIARKVGLSVAALSLSVALLLCVLPAIAAAQTPGNFATVDLSAAPATPTAFQNVTVTAVSYTADLSTSYLTWYKNGVKAAEGVGASSFSFTTGGFGSVTAIIVSVKTQDGQTIQQGLEVRPADVNLNWEALSYTPPFYKGKALYSYQAPLRVTAVPQIADGNGVRIDPSNLIFSWQVDFKARQDLSGLGKDTAVLKAAIPFKETSVTVTVSTLDGNTTATKTIVVKPNAPQIVLYRKSPLYGLMTNMAVGDSFLLTEPELSLTAIPYFFDTGSPAENMTYLWSMNGSTVAGVSGNTLTVRQTKNAAGSSNISLSATHTRDMFEYGNASVVVDFNGQTAGGALLNSRP